VLLAGVAIRLLWLVAVHGSVDAVIGVGEATRVALSVARGHGLADPFFAGQGPSAHLMPLYPLVVGGLIRCFGSSSGGMLVLLAFALAQWAATLLVARRLFAVLGLSPMVLRRATLLLCLLPVHAPQEAIDFRYWEGGVSALLAMLSLWWIVTLDRAGVPGWTTLAAAAMLAALTFFVAPPVGLAVCLGWGCWALRRLPPRRVAGFAVAGCCAVLLFVAPWAWRNERVLGSAITTRSNFGLELAIANHPAAVSGRRPAETFAERLLAVHPFASPTARVALRAEGEVAYSRRLGADTRRWIAAHPLDFARLYLRHLGQFFFPRPWQYYFSGWEALRVERAVIVSLVQALGLIGLAVLLVRRRRGAGYVALYVAAIALPFAAFQPTMRYSYLLWTLLAFAAASLGAGGRMRQIGQPPHLAPPAHHRVEDQPAEQA